ncbi:MAG: NAD-dependent epimerase/dehydratase family protein, partial [Terriglobia bacterium]
LITGGGGFIGSWIVKNLVYRGARPWVYDTGADSPRLRILLSDNQRASVKSVRGDIRQLEDLDRAVAENGITHLIHLAALQMPACAKDPLLGAHINVIGTMNVFEVARRRRDVLKRVVYASSQGVYGPEELYGKDKIGEDAPLQPGTHYGVFKQANEGSARIYYSEHGVSSVGLRPGIVYGVGRDQGTTSAPTKAIKATIAGRPYTIRFTGGLDLQYVKDVADIFLRCALIDIQGATAYTIRGTVVQMNEFLVALTSLLPRAKHLICVEGRPFPVAYDFDNSPLGRAIGNLPFTPLQEGIFETARIFERLLIEGRLETKDLEE